MAAVATWTASTAYSLGDIRKASTTQYTGVHFKVTTAGTSGGTEPTWSSGFGSETSDNNIVWTAISSVYSEVNKINPSNIVPKGPTNFTNSIVGINRCF